ncbi:type II toxin-antitoxin system VapC family toxin [Sphingomonas sp. SUN039]|uniref:type II toxin-antitoxin system VapC family toxin n=1 Tax=Sphingomonas sp. SUN039 TaxID=2937787 RepID=UPI00216479C0|nr:type II toxin-antitoxin system VapC family toxin [Sphingomonas sp. SUN039]UVO53309.1 type II toxin-antitoxin system VapC family toxin [Sphingomonas sp. SUN039]
MILADTCIWADYIDRGDYSLAALLENGAVVTHPFVVAEVLLGNLADRKMWKDQLARLPEFLPVRHSDVMALIDAAELGGSGVGYVDAHLLAAVLARPGTAIWTRDKKLNRVAGELGVAFEPA